MTHYQMGRLTACDDAWIAGKRRRFTHATPEFRKGYAAGFRYAMLLRKE